LPEFHECTPQVSANQAITESGVTDCPIHHEIAGKLGHRLVNAAVLGQGSRPQPTGSGTLPRGEQKIICHNNQINVKTSSNPGRIEEYAARESSQRSGGGFTERDSTDACGTVPEPRGREQNRTAAAHLLRRRYSAAAGRPTARPCGPQRDPMRSRESGASVQNAQGPASSCSVGGLRGRRRGWRALARGWLCRCGASVEGGVGRGRFAGCLNRVECVCAFACGR
jgi:hypothetical protein